MYFYKAIQIEFVFDICHPTNFQNILNQFIWYLKYFITLKFSSVILFYKNVFSGTMLPYIIKVAWSKKLGATVLNWENFDILMRIEAPKNTMVCSVFQTFWSWKLFFS